MSEWVCKSRKWNLKQFVHILPKFSVFLRYFFFIFQKKQLSEKYISKETPKQIEKTICNNKFKILCKKETFSSALVSFVLLKKKFSFVRNSWVEKRKKLEEKMKQIFGERLDFFCFFFYLFLLFSFFREKKETKLSRHVKSLLSLSDKIYVFAPPPPILFDFFFFGGGGGVNFLYLKSSIFESGRDKKKIWQDFGAERTLSATFRPLIGQYRQRTHNWIFKKYDIFEHFRSFSGTFFFKIRIWPKTAQKWLKMFFWTSLDPQDDLHSFFYDFWPFKIMTFWKFFQCYSVV